MKTPNIPHNESERLRALKSYSVLDTLPEQDFEDITKIASEICQTPIALVSLIDSKRQWFKSNHGLDARETSRDYAFCAHAINNPEEIFVVENSREDDRFVDNPLVTGYPEVIFYAGAPLVTSDGFALGTICVIDHKTRELTETQLQTLHALSRQTVKLLEFKKINERLIENQNQTKAINEELFTSNKQLLHQNEEKALKADELRRSFLLLEEAESIAKLGGWEFDLITGNLYWTAETYRIYDTSPDKFDPTVDAGVGLFLPGSKNIINAALDAAIEDCQGYDLELETYTTKGRKIDVGTTCVVTVDDGKPIKLTGSFQDITERKTIERDLIKAKELAESLYEKQELANTDLRKAKDLLDTTNAMAKIGSWDFNFVTNHLEWTLETYKIFEISHLIPSDKLYHKYRSRIPQHDLEQLDLYIGNAVKNGMSFKYEHSVVFDGAPDKYVLGVGDVYKNEEGNVIGIKGTAQDITDQKNSQEKIVLSEQLLNEAQAIANIGSWALNIETNEVTWTHELFKMYGFDPKLPVPSYEEQAQLFTPISWEKLGQSVSQVINKGIPYELELKTIRKDGSNGWLWARGERVLNKTGNAAYLRGIAQDITERKNAQQKLELLSERLGLATSVSGIGIWEYSIIDGSLKWDNNMFALYGVESNTFSETYDAWYSGMHPDDRDRAEQELNDAIAGEGSFNTEFRVVWPDKSIHNIRAFAKVSFNSKGKALKMIGANYDITDLKEKEKDLAVLNATKDKFFSIVAHDLRSPLSSLNAFTGLLIDHFDQLSKEDILRMSGQLKASVDNTIKMTDNLINWAMIQMNKTKNDINYAPEPIVVQEIVSNICEVYKDVAARKGINVSCPVVDLSLKILGEKNQIEFIIRNLINNAIKFTNKGGFVKLAVKPLSEEEIEISVSDNGLGISDSMKAELFSIGRSKSMDGTAGEGGSGLGLMLSYEYIKINDGQIDVESEIGNGTSFRVRFKSC